MPHLVTSDGVRLHYEEAGTGRPLVMLHGWSSSGRFFCRNVDALAGHARVLTVDLRGHGDSEDPGRGYRVARLAKDLRDLLVGLDLHDVTVLGWSLGCPVLWSYLELFGTDRLRSAVFVEQTPRQYYAEDWTYTHATCFDEAGLARLQTRVETDPAAFDRRQLATTTAAELPAELTALLLAEMAKCPPRARTALMADHTRQDWRDLLPHLDLPSLVLVGVRDATLDHHGAEAVADLVPGAATVFFERSGHAPFLDEPEKFNETVARFLTAGPDR